MFEQSIKNSVEVTGIGLHSGEPIKIVLEPAKEGSGITFIHAISGKRIELHPNNITQTKLATRTAFGPKFSPSSILAFPDVGNHQILWFSLTV